MGRRGALGPGGSQGHLCLGGPIACFVEDLGSSGQDGFLERDVDLTPMPTRPKRAVRPGETWSFQAGSRDENPGNTSSFTNGVGVTLE